MESAKFEQLISDIIKNNISDLHISPGKVPYIRIASGDIYPVEQFGILSEQDVADIAEFIMKRPFTETTYDTSYAQGGVRFRVNISRVIDGVSLSFRSIPTKIPDPASIMLPESLLRLTQREKGIILITGPTGSGKSTTMAALVEYINQHNAKHIITLEDPIEFTFQNKKSLVHQRELGKHFESFSTGIRSLLREDPDVIVIGEMRDLATIEAAVTLAETGHLVISTLHTNDTIQTVDRIIQSFPAEAQNQIRLQFGMTMIAIVTQNLVPRSDAIGGRIAVREVMVNNDSVRNLIIRGETHQLYGILEISRQDGMNLMDDAVAELLKRNIITRTIAEMYMRDRSRLNFLNQ